MHILILANNDVGLYKFRKELMERLIEDGHTVYASLPYGDMIPDIESLGCKVIITEISRRGTNPIQDLKLMQAYKKIIKEKNPDIVFTYTIKPNVYGGAACASLNVPYVANITGLGTAVENGGLMQKITLTLYRFGLRKVQTVFFQNKENEGFFTSKKLALGKHKMLPGSGVNLQSYKPVEYPGENTIEFLFVARLMKEKGIDQYLDMAKVIRKKYPQTRFHICGYCEEEYEGTIKELQQNDVVVYHGLVKDMSRIYEKVHCVVHPTYYPEGMSNVLLEASACARPIITTDRSGCREVIGDCVNGYIVKQQDSQDLIKKVEKFIGLSYEQKKEMGLAGRMKVEKEFDRQLVIEKYMNEIEIVRDLK